MITEPSGPYNTRYTGDHRHSFHHTGAGCTNLPPGAFYPWFHLLPVNNLAGQHCAWALTNDIPGQLSNFGGAVGHHRSPQGIMNTAVFVCHRRWAGG